MRSQEVPDVQKHQLAGLICRFDVDNVEAAYQASELVLLNIWNLLRPHIGKKSSAAGKAITAVLHNAMQLHLQIASSLLDRKLLPHVGTRDGISMAVQTRS